MPAAITLVDAIFYFCLSSKLLYPIPHLHNQIWPYFHFSEKIEIIKTKFSHMPQLILQIYLKIYFFFTVSFLFFFELAGRGGGR